MDPGGLYGGRATKIAYGLMMALLLVYVGFFLYMIWELFFE